MAECTQFDADNLPADFRQEDAHAADRSWGPGNWVACVDCPRYGGSVPQPYVVHHKDNHR